MILHFQLNLNLFICPKRHMHGPKHHVLMVKLISAGFKNPFSAFSILVFSHPPTDSLHVSKSFPLSTLFSRKHPSYSQLFHLFFYLNKWIRTTWVSIQVFPSNPFFSLAHNIENCLGLNCRLTIHKTKVKSFYIYIQV